MLLAFARPVAKKVRPFACAIEACVHVKILEPVYGVFHFDARIQQVKQQEEVSIFNSLLARSGAILFFHMAFEYRIAQVRTQVLS